MHIPILICLVKCSSIFFQNYQLSMRIGCVCTILWFRYLTGLIYFSCFFKYLIHQVHNLIHHPYCLLIPFYSFVFFHFIFSFILFIRRIFKIFFPISVIGMNIRIRVCRLFFSRNLGKIVGVCLPFHFCYLIQNLQQSLAHQHQTFLYLYQKNDIVSQLDLQGI